MRFVLVTPARNEARFIEQTIQSVIAQTARPSKWVIVSDASTDGTDEIVQKYLPKHAWMELVRMPDHQERNFACKVHAFNAGYARVRGMDYEAIGSLDADVSFGDDYFAFLLQKLAEDPALGLVGTPFQEASQPIYDYRFVSIEHVSGICQLFRRKCFEAIGGYIPVKGGSIDHIAVLTSRMKGWKTRSFPDRICFHHRAIGTAQSNVLTARFRYGVKDHAMGNTPLWELCRTLYQMTKPPVVLGGLALATGFVWGWVRQAERPVSRELVVFHRAEQRRRLKRFLLGGLR